MNRYPLWKYLLILAVVVIGFLYSLPNIYVPDPAIQISGIRSGVEVDANALNTATKALEENGIQYFGAEAGEKSALIRFATQDDQLRARTIVQRALSQENYVVAFNLAPTTPQWLVDLGAGPMSLGLDLAGGVHFLLEVDTESVLAKEMEGFEDDISGLIRKEKLYGVSTRLTDGEIVITADSDDLRTDVLLLLKKELSELETKRTERGGKYIVTAVPSDAYIREKEKLAVQQNLTTLRNRVNEIGVSEPLVQTQGRNRIVVQLPGIQDTARAKKILGKTANLEFRLEAPKDGLASQKEHFEFRDEIKQARYGGAWLEKRPFVTGQNVTGATPGFDDQSSSPMVSISLDSKGAGLMHRKTRKHVNESMAIVLIEYDTKVREEVNEAGETVIVTEQVPNPKMVSLANINEALSKRFQITGLDSPEEASELALYIRAGALAAPMSFVEERTIGASLGQENIDLGVKSVQLGLVLVLIFMMVFYKVFGFFANLALAVNLMVLVAVMSMFGATLTLPGIAGIVLTVGMAVDANVLIFSRIKEELKAGSSSQTAINSGYDSAFSTILDANLTTFIVAIILYAIGSGPVKGFAVTLAIGIITSMFTAIVGTRALVNLAFGGRNVKKLWI